MSCSKIPSPVMLASSAYIINLEIVQNANTWKITDENALIIINGTKIKTIYKT